MVDESVRENLQVENIDHDQTCREIIEKSPVQNSVDTPSGQLKSNDVSRVSETRSILKQSTPLREAISKTRVKGIESKKRVIFDFKNLQKSQTSSKQRRLQVSKKKKNKQKFNPWTLRLTDPEMDRTFSSYLRRETRYKACVVTVIFAAICLISLLAFLIANRGNFEEIDD